MQVKKLVQRLIVVTLFATFMVVTVSASAAYMPVKKGAVGPGIFASPQSCSCHGDFQNQWASSMHAKALDDPIYQAVIAKAKAEAGPAVGEFCETCHAPGAMMMGGIDSAKGDINTGGVSCDFCHQVVAQTAKDPGNFSLGFPETGPDGVRRAQIMDPAAMHPAQGSQLHNEAQFCGACHDVNHPTNGLKLEGTYTEWKNSPFAAQNVTCQNCHMGAQPGSAAPFQGAAAMGAPTRDNMFAMTFTGANVAQAEPQAATALLKNAAKIKVETQEIVAPGSAAKAKVSVSNVGAGHSIPTGLTDVRQMWLVIEAVDANNKRAELGKTVFGTVLEDAKGNAHAEVWNATKIQSDNRIKSGETFVQEVDYTMPAEAEGVQVVATLKYQSAPDELAKSAGVENPTTDMAMGKAVVYANEEAKATFLKPKSGITLNSTVIAAVAGVLILVVGAVLFFVRKKGSATIA